MQKISLLFESPPWLVLLCLLAGLAYGTVLYYKIKTPWNKKVNYALFALRFFLVFLTSLLLLGPLVKQIFNTYEKPGVVLAIDNSASIAEIESSATLGQLVQNVFSLRSHLEENGYNTEIRLINDRKNLKSGDSVVFNHPETNLNEFLRSIENDYESRNIANVILISDGIYNQGSNPAYRPFSYTIHTVGLGDTTEKADLILNGLVYNKLAYQGNKFPLIAEIFAVGFEGESLEISIVHQGKTLEKREVEIDSDDQFLEEKFLIGANEKGYQQYKVILKAKEGELSLNNNQKNAFVDIIEGKERILIAAPSPHPDIKALQLAIESNRNYEVETYIEGIDKMPDGKFDVYILHQIPNLRNSHQQLLNRIKQESLPAWYILGNQSAISTFNQINNLVEIRVINNQKDEVLGYFNSNFSAFNYSSQHTDQTRRFPPVSVPFAQFRVNPQADVLLYQKIGAIETQKPLLVVGNDNGKSAIMLGSGIWQWRIAEYALNENTAAFDEMASKIVQFLSTKDDKRKFKVYPVKNEFFDNEPVVFETEVYNDIYQRIYGQAINLKITDEEGNASGYRYVTSEANSRYRINNMAPGVYRFEASTTLNGRKETSTGSFAVKDLQIEDTRLAANHNLLRNLARENGGNFYQQDEWPELKNDLATLKAQSVIHSQEDYLSIINLKWLFFLLMLIFSAEWFLRKYFGSY